MGVPGSANFLLAGAQGYQIERSLRFNSPDSAYLNRTPASAGNRKTWTWSGWVKRSKLGVETVLFHAYDGSSSRRAQFLFNTSDQFVMNQGGGGTSAIGNTTAVFRDVSAWYHFVFYADYANTTFKLYVNNVEQTLSYSSSVINADGQINAAIAHQIGSVGGSSAYFDGYLTEVHFIDGQALTPSSFGETDTITGVWKPKKYAGTYGTNGFYLKFADNSGTTSTTLGKDSSGNGNNWTPNNFSVTAGAGNDSLIDTPTPYADGGNGRGNYCTGNPLYIPSSNSRMSLTNGNLEWGQAATNANSSMAGTFLMRSGKWYWEVTIGSFGGYSTIGMQTDANTAWRGSGTVLYRNDGQKVIGGTNSAYGASFTANDVLGFAYDADAGTLTCYKNNTSQGTIYSSGTGNSWVPAIHDDNAGVGVTYYHQLNFGQRAFAYTPPSGFKALNTQNLPEPSIKKPSSYMDTLLYTGNGSARSITGLNFSPDFAWIKTRSGGAGNHNLFDTVRGANKMLISNLTDSEYSRTQALTSFDANGFSLGTSTDSDVNINTNTYVAWCWDESATPGFDIVTYTGTGSARTVSHSLGVAPNMIIVKNRTNASQWAVYHANTDPTPQNYNLLLNSPAAKELNSLYWNNTAPTSSVFSLGGSTAGNENGSSIVAYLWAEVAGFSKIGFYYGNGSTDGPFVFCGFRPRWILFKGANVANTDWMIYDTARSTTNVTNLRLDANSSGSEAVSTGHNFDILSNGFKLREISNNFNNANSTYIFAAFAESPFKYSLAR